MKKLCLSASLAALTALAAGSAEAGVVQVIGGYEVAYPQGKIGGSSAQGLPANYIAIPPAKEYYLDYQVRFHADFEWVKGGKLPGLVGGSHTSGCNSIVPNGWSARFMWRGGGRGEVYLYHQNRRSGCGDSYVFPADGGYFKKEAWNRITERVVINSPGKNDGLIEAWLNGRKMVTLNNLKLRGNVAENVALVDNVSLQTFYGGSSSSWAPPRTTHATYSQYFVRDDLPDFSVTFEAANAVSVRQTPGAAAARGGTRALSWLGGSATLGRAGDIGAIDIYDAAGRLLRSLPGSGPRAWDGLDAHGRAVPRGILMVR